MTTPRKPYEVVLTKQLYRQLTGRPCPTPTHPVNPKTLRRLIEHCGDQLDEDGEAGDYCLVECPHLEECQGVWDSRVVPIIPTKEIQGGLVGLK